jgi:nucleotide-binding universal stress UspA family protein
MNAQHAAPNEQFAPSYMVYVAGKSAPTVFHDSLQTAIGEATRLANKEQAEVAVLQVVAVGQPDPRTPLDWFFADNVEVACCGAVAEQPDENEEADPLAERLDALLAEVTDILKRCEQH